MRCVSLITTITILLIGSAVRAGEFNQVLNVGDAAPSWKALPGTDGKEHSLDDFKDKDAVVLIFTCATCDTARDYEERIDALVKKFGGTDGKVGIIGVCVNTVPADRLDKLKERVKKQQLTFTVMYDESQKIAKDYGANWTPEFYVLNKERKIIYMGAMDDATDASKVSKRFVEEALAAALKGDSPTIKETAARGCLVKWAREKR